MLTNNVTWQLVELDNHRVSKADRTIKTFENHFLMDLAIVDIKFPMQLWCYLLPQAKLTLSLLCTLQLNPAISAYKELEGIFDYNIALLAPTGTKSLIFEPPTRRAAWAPHTANRWYLGPAMDNYRCGFYFVTKTRTTRTSGIAKLFSTHYMLPSLSKQDRTDSTV